MTDKFKEALSVLENFELPAPRFPQAVDSRLEYDPTPGARTPVTLEYPGLNVEIPGLEAVALVITGPNWGSTFRLTPAEAMDRRTVTGQVNNAALSDSRSYKINATATFIFADEGTEIRVQSADRMYDVSRRRDK